MNTLYPIIQNLKNYMDSENVKILMLVPLIIGFISLLLVGIAYMLSIIFS